MTVRIRAATSPAITRVATGPTIQVGVLTDGFRCQLTSDDPAGLRALDESSAQITLYEVVDAGDQPSLPRWFQRQAICVCDDYVLLFW